MSDINKFTSKEVLNKVLLDSSGNAVEAFSHTTQEALNAALDTTNNRLNVSLAGGTISGDVTISGDLTVNGSATNSYDEIVNGDLHVKSDSGNSTSAFLVERNDGTDVFVVDTSNSRVGIGEPSIDAKLHLTTATAGLVNQKFESAGGAAWRIGIPASQTYFAFDNANDNLSSPKVVINSSGKLGLGTVSPSGKLTLSNGSASAPLSITASNSYIQLGSEDFGSGGLGKFMIGFGYTDVLTNTNAPAYIGFEETSTSGDTKGDLTFYTRNVTTDTLPTQRMVITDDGNIGIGLSNP